MDYPHINYSALPKNTDTYLSRALSGVGWEMECTAWDAKPTTQLAPWSGYMGSPGFPRKWEFLVRTDENGPWWVKEIKTNTYAYRGTDPDFPENIVVPTRWACGHKREPGQQKCPIGLGKCRDGARG